MRSAFARRVLVGLLVCVESASSAGWARRRRICAEPAATCCPPCQVMTCPPAGAVCCPPNPGAACPLPSCGTPCPPTGIICCPPGGIICCPPSGVICSDPPPMPATPPVQAPPPQKPKPAPPAGTSTGPKMNWAPRPQPAAADDARSSTKPDSQDASTAPPQVADQDRSAPYDDQRIWESADDAARRAKPLAIPPQEKSVADSTPGTRKDSRTHADPVAPREPAQPAPESGAPVPPPTEKIPDTTVRQENGQVHIELAEAVLFDSGKAILKSDAQVVLDRVAEVLKKDYLGYRVAIEGHTDTDPIRYSPWRDNQELSEARANSVREYLLFQVAVPDAPWEVAGYGPARPVAPNGTPEGKARNRRVEVVIHPAP